MRLLILLVIVAGLGCGGCYAWVSRRGSPTVEPPTTRRRIPLVTEAVAYIGTILLLAGFGAAVGQRWNDMTAWAHVGVFAAVAAVFLVVGVPVRTVSEPAAQRMVSVVWLLSAGAAAATAGLAAGDAAGWSDGPTALTVGIVGSGYAGALWYARRRVLQHLAVFAGLVVLICGAIATITSQQASPLAFTFALWAFGLGWAGLGWWRYLPPRWVAVPLGVLLALLAPSFSVAEYGWVYLIGIGTAAAVMAASITPRNPVLLAQGALAMFGYVTSAVVRYFGDSLGVPATLMVTGLLILGLATLSTRLMRPPRPPTPPPRQSIQAP